MSEEHDSWFKEAFGVDLGQVAQGIKDEGSAVVGQVTNTVTQVVHGVQGAVEGAIDDVTGAATGIVKKVASAVSPSGGGGGGSGAGGGTGSFPLGGSVGRSGRNAPNDVRAVQTALGIAADGQCGGQTIAAIEAYQRNMGQSKPDGRVDAGGTTERALAGGGQPAAAPAPPPAPDDGAAGGLLGQLQKGAAGLLDDAKDLGGRAVQGAGEMLADAKQVASDAANALGQVDVRADVKVPFNSGAPLNSPSYVNAQNPSPNLAGGSTASAGDSTFVTGQQKGTLLGKATAIRSAAKKLVDAEAAIESQQKGDKSALETAKNLKSIADSMYQVANAIDKVTGDDNAEALKKGGKMLELGDKLIQAAETISQVSSANSKLDAFQNNPSKETAEAWARSVGSLFSGLSSLVPDVEPKFISDYWKGLLSAPSNYIEAFITMQNVYYGNIDKEAGLSQSRGVPGLRDLGLGGHAATKRVSDGSWEGDLTDIYFQGYFQPKLNDGKTFNDFMISHRKSEGMDLWDTDIRVGKAALLNAISRDVSDEEPAKQSWMMHVGKF